MVLRAPCPASSAPQVLSVDDFALRKRHTYGPIMVDLELGRPLALLPAREAATVAQWLQAHPGVEVYVHDRAEAYAEAARLGAPAACQVADRFHLRQNLAEVLTDVFRAHAPPWGRIRAQCTAVPTPRHDPADPATGSRLATGPLAPPQPSMRAGALAAARRAQRVVQYAQVWTSHRQGWMLDAIAHQVGRSRRTVRRDLQRPVCPERQPRHGRGRSILDPYNATLLAGWNHGCRNGWPLFRTIRRQGFQGQYGLGALSVQRMRQAHGVPPGHRRRTPPLPAVTEGPRRPLTPRRAT